MTRLQWFLERPICSCFLELCKFQQSTLNQSWIKIVHICYKSYNNKKGQLFDLLLRPRLKYKMNFKILKLLQERQKKLQQLVFNFTSRELL